MQGTNKEKIKGWVRKQHDKHKNYKENKQTTSRQGLLTSIFHVC
jgi:hypothetical protein